MSPLYDYKCEDCGFIAEDIGYSRHKVRRKKCRCGGNMLRMLGAPGLLQGKGYTTIKQNAPERAELEQEVKDWGEG